MPRVCYQKWNPRKESQDVIGLADGVLRELAARGFTLTVRQTYYQMIARDLFPESWVDPVYNSRQGLDPNTKNTVKNYKKFARLLSDAREAGLIDWNHLTDRGRQLERLSHWQDPQQFLDSVCPQFAIDMWERQPKRVECFVEKDALSEVVGRACDPWDVPYLACKGYPSASAVWEAAHNRYKRWHDRGNCDEIVIIQLSDHDASGVDMTRDLQHRLRLFASPYEEGSTAAAITVERIALTMGQVEEYTPPPNPAKESDPRFAGYRDEYGNESWELDALDPQVIVDLIEEAIQRHLDIDIYNEDREREEDWRQRLEAIPSRWAEIQGLLDE